MRSICILTLLFAILIGPADAAELQVVCPPLVRDGMKELAAAYMQQTGVAVAVRSDVMGKIMGDIETGMPAADVVLLPPDLMDALVKNNGVKSGTRVPVGRVEIALAVRSTLISRQRGNCAPFCWAPKRWLTPDRDRRATAWKPESSIGCCIGQVSLVFTP
jgi:ABC-type molybdate transport system substrate-binding protein